MAHLDLEEQEQLDQLNHFWRQWGNLITWLLIAALAAYAAWNGWQWWQRSQAARAAALYEQVDEAARGNDLARLERAWADIQDKAGGTAYAQQAGLLAAKALFEQKQPERAKAALEWIVQHSSDDLGLRAIAQLRLAALLIDGKAYDAALAQLGGDFPPSFAPLVADRKGDIYQLQGNRSEAIAQYRRALAGFADRLEYRQLVEIKLSALGVDPRAASADGAVKAAS